jgi:cellulose synthase/poly-beta-1,6-N-acetylglucosamine synthase-like glycosyltransferase
MKQPLVSVCIPTFQHESFIADCLDSVLAQKTNFDFEIILGEDGSTDGTRIICQAYADKNPDRIRLFLRKDKDKLKILGRKSGRFNYLENFKAARGKYIATLDGDDCWLTTDKLQKQVDLLEQYPKAFLCSTAFFTGKSFPKSERVTTPYKFNFFPQNTLGYLSYSGHISNWLFRNELEGFLATPLATKAPILDLLLCLFQGKRGDSLPK